MKKKTLIIAALTISVLCLTACDGCGTKKNETSEVPLVVLDGLDVASENSEDPKEDTDTGVKENSETAKRDTKKDDSKKATVTEDKTAKKTEVQVKKETPSEAPAAQASQPSDSTWQTPGNQPAPSTLQPSVSSGTDTDSKITSDDGVIELPLIPLN
mgnify:CR=1 FL=1